MNRFFLFILLTIVCKTTFAQRKLDFDSTYKLAQYAKSAFNNDEDRLEFVYRWITDNIKYSSEDVLAINRGINSRAIIDVAFKRKKGVCENFAAIFSDVCKQLDLRSEVIDGYTRQNGLIDKQGHSWTAVETMDGWFLFDATWDAGRKDLQFFKRNGAEFISSHMPFDPLWQLSKYPITNEQFYNNQFAGSKSDVFNYSDSIDLYFLMDSLQRFESMARRIEKAGITDRKVETNYKIVKNELEMQRQEEQLNWYNTAIHFLNECTDQLNDFINYRNVQFKPTREDEVLKQMLNGIQQKISTSIYLLDQVDGSKALLVFGTGPVREQINRLQKKLDDQTLFLNNYLKVVPEERGKLF